MLQRNSKSSNIAPSSPPCGIDEAFHDGDQLVVIGWSAATDITVKAEGQEALFIKRTGRKDVSDTLGDRVAIPEEPGFEARFPLSSFKTKDKVTFAVEAPGQEAGQTFSLAVRFLEGDETQLPLVYHVDRAIRDEHGNAFIAGWAAEADDVRFAVTIGERPAVFGHQVYNRVDVSDHLLREGLRPSGHRHGFALSLKTDSDHCQIAVHRPGDSGDKLIDVHFERVSRDVLFSTIIGVLGRPRRDMIDGYRAIFNPLRKGHVENVSVALEKVYGPAIPDDQPPKVSIIIPLYKEWFYLLDHITMQSLPGTDDIEWIFVCDDPTIQFEMDQWMSTRGNQITRPTRAVYLSANGGYAAANNKGAGVARGEYLLLLNSDALFRTTKPLQKAVQLLDDDHANGLIGFTLLYEDGTVQHDGITLMPSHFFGGQLVCEHVGKGLPPSEDIITERTAEVDVVTGAAMLLRRPEDGIVLDESYVIGDFEDADLCLRVRRSGRKIQIVRSTDFFHLERQSLRHVGHVDGRQAITFMNCLQFNERWFGGVNAKNAPEDGVAL